MGNILLSAEQKTEILTALALFKADLGIKNDTRDDYFAAQLLAAREELAGKGVSLDMTAIEDNMLLSDFAAWRYRLRMEDAPEMSDSLRYRIRNRVAKRRAQDDGE